MMNLPGAAEMSARRLHGPAAIASTSKYLIECTCDHESVWGGAMH